IGAFDSPKFIGLPVGEVLKVAKDHIDVAVTEPLANGDGLNVMIKREVVALRLSIICLFMRHSFILRNASARFSVRI
ncbi:hypothetical protein O5172_25595, partial [Escherichia coli]|nr:hypothetical protein [Escherichia coli]